METVSSRRQFLEMYQVELNEWAPPVSVVILMTLVFVITMINYRVGYMNNRYTATKETIAEAMQNVAPQVENIIEETAPVEEIETVAVVPTVESEKKEHMITMPAADKTPKMEELYALNPDTAGWVHIDGMVIDYPVMQTPDDEQYYLNRDFDGNYSAYGCILADTDCQIGTGTAVNDYADGTLPSTNIILHGHNMKNGTMFGNLDEFRKESFEKEHSIIKFSSLYEDREYEICAVFLSQVYRQNEDVFKYYKFFNAENENEFNDFYKNIKKMSLYDTGVEAQYGDEFITLSVCAYHVENGRLVVVGKRIK